jgi:hypothetical protein
MVAVLFARRDSVYKQIPDCDVWDIDRDATQWNGGCPVVAHPPCRAWGRLAAFSKHPETEPALALFAVAMVRRFGGVLEHPYLSRLWDAAGLPRPNRRDRFGGWTLSAPQWWWGHRADKATWFYIVGCEPGEVPDIPFRLGEPTHVVQTRKRAGHLPHLQRAERERTPLALAEWLVKLAERCVVLHV